MTYFFTLQGGVYDTEKRSMSVHEIKKRFCPHLDDRFMYMEVPGEHQMIALADSQSVDFTAKPVLWCLPNARM